MKFKNAIAAGVLAVGSLIPVAAGASASPTSVSTVQPDSCGSSNAVAYIIVSEGQHFFCNPGTIYIENSNVLDEIYTISTSDRFWVSWANPTSTCYEHTGGHYQWNISGSEAETAESVQMSTNTAPC